MKIFWNVTLFFLVLTSSSCGTEPQSYDDCILKHLSRPVTKSATEALIEACQSKFPEKIPFRQDLQVLPETEIAKLNGQFRVGSGVSTGTLYNGTDSWTVLEMTILVWESSDTPGLFDDQLFGKRYKVKLESAPLTNTSFSLQTNSFDSTGYKWRIAEAKGVKVAE